MTLGENEKQPELPPPNSSDEASAQPASQVSSAPPAQPTQPFPQDPDEPEISDNLEPPPIKNRATNIMIRACQLLLFLTGLVIAIFIIPRGHLEQMQYAGFLIALSMSWWLTPEIRSRALKLGLVDKPGEERRIHKTAVPRLGGVAIFISILFSTLR